MNGFVSAILTLLLSWIRSLINRLWSLLSTEQGGSLVAVLRAHWKTIFLAFCIGGFLLDRLIYLIRWRPYYVWGTKLGRLKRRLKGEKNHEERDFEPADLQPPPPPTVPPFAYRRPQPGTEPEDDFEAIPPLPPKGPYIQDDISGHTLGYAPLNVGYSPEPQDGSAYPYALKKADFHPSFDDSTITWTSPPEEETRPTSSPFYGHDPLIPADASAEPIENLGQHLFPAFGMSKPEPAQYLQDVQSGFAPPLAPETLYPARPLLEDEPIHPGLDSETFQQNIGLTSPQEPLEPVEEEHPWLSQEPDFPNTTYVPFYQNQENARRSRNPFSNLARKARSLVSSHDEDDPLSIRDLRPTVDIKDAFHSPVFPHNSEESGDDD